MSFQRIYMSRNSTHMVSTAVVEIVEKHVAHAFFLGVLQQMFLHFRVVNRALYATGSLCIGLPVQMSSMQLECQIH